MNKIGIDLGGTKIEGVLLDENNEILAKKRVETQKQNGYDFILNSIVSLIDELSVNVNNKLKIGVGINGTFSKITGQITHSSTLCIINKNLKHDLENILNQEILMDNDANCFAIAEATIGAGSGFNSVFGVIMGTGVGAGIVINGKLHHGKLGIAGEWGHTSINPNGKKCYCGNIGCVDTYISGPSLEKHWNELTGKQISLASILEHSQDPHFEKWKSEFLEYFGCGLSNVINIFDPDVIVLGGGVSNIPFLYDEGKNVVYSKIVGSDIDTPIIQNQLGDSAGVLGACLL